MTNPNATTVREIQKAMMRLIRANIFGGKDLAIIEPANGPRPDVTYCSIRFLSAKPMHHEVFDYDDEEGEYTEFVRGERYCRVRLTFYGKKADQLAVDCQNLLRSNLALFETAPITGFGEVGETQNVSSEYMGQIEDRTTFTVELYANLSAKYKAGWIETVSGDIRREGGDDPYEVTVTK